LKILVTFALDFEFAPWRRLHRFTKTSESGPAAGEGIFGDAVVRVALTGIGSARAGYMVRRALEWRPDICVTAGVAGSLQPGYRVGQVFAARNIMELESGRTVAADRSLVQRAEDCGALIVDRLLTSSTVVSSAEGKKRLGSMAAAVEMESFAVAAEAVANGIPAIAIRAISDDADEDLPMDFGEVLDESGGVRPARMVRALARAPHKLPALVRLGRQSRTASLKLAHFLQAYVAGLGAGANFGRELMEARRA
jgi:adenosylhomocysteine nucleosidase